LKETIADAPEAYFDVPAHRQALLNQTKAVETLLTNSTATANAIISKLDAMEGDVRKWVVNEETKDTLLGHIGTEKIFVFVERE